jgi:hypothetical protein
MEGVANAKLVVRMALAADAQDRAVPGISELAYATYSVASTSSHFSPAMPVPSVCLSYRVYYCTISLSRPCGAHVAGRGRIAACTVAPTQP